MKQHFDVLSEEEKLDGIYHALESLLSRIEALEDNQGRTKSQAAPIKKKSKIEAYIKTAFKSQRDKYERNNKKRFEIPMEDVISYFMGIESFVENFNTWNETGDKNYKPTIFYSGGEEESMEHFHTSTFGKWIKSEEQKKEQKRNANIVGEPKAKSKSKKEKWPRDLSFEEFIQNSFAIAEKGINSRMKKRGLDVVTTVTWMEALEKAQSDKSFMENFNLWKDGDNDSRPTMFFEDNNRGINHLKFNTAGEFRKSTFTKRTK